MTAISRSEFDERPAVLELAGKFLAEIKAVRKTPPTRSAIDLVFQFARWLDRDQQHAW